MSGSEYTQWIAYLTYDPNKKSMNKLSTHDQIKRDQAILAEILP